MNIHRVDYKLGPSDTAYLIEITKMPAFMEKKFPDITSWMKGFLENHHIELYMEPEIGPVPTYYLKMSYYETSDERFKSFIDLWTSGITDPGSFCAHYHGAIAEGMGYAHINHSMDIIISQYDTKTMKMTGYSILDRLVPTEMITDVDPYTTPSYRFVKASVTLKGTMEFDIPSVRKFEDLGIKYRDYMWKKTQGIKFQPEYTPMTVKNLGGISHV